MNAEMKRRGEWNERGNELRKYGRGFNSGPNLDQINNEGTGDGQWMAGGDAVCARGRIAAVADTSFLFLPTQRDKTCTHARKG